MFSNAGINTVWVFNMNEWHVFLTGDDHPSGTPDRNYPSSVRFLVILLCVSYFALSIVILVLSAVFETNYEHVYLEVRSTYLFIGDFPMKTFVYVITFFFANSGMFCWRIRNKIHPHTKPQNSQRTC